MASHITDKQNGNAQPFRYESLINSDFNNVHSDAEKMIAIKSVIQLSTVQK